MAIQSRALAENLTFGAKVRGVTPAALKDDEVRTELNALFRERGVIVFEGMEASQQLQLDVSQVFGPLKEHPVKNVLRPGDGRLPGVIEIKTRPDAGIVEIDGEPLMTWQPWHFDHAYNDELNYAGVLRAISIASKGGRTGFVDGIQIYRDMKPEIRAEADRLHLLYNLDLRLPRQKFGLPPTFRELRPDGTDIEEMMSYLPRAIHPASWTRESGEKVFHMTPYGCQGIVGNETEEGISLLSAIWEEAMRVARPYFHQWQDDHMVIWDNLRVLHAACGCHPDEERIMHRTTIKGDYGLGRFEKQATAAAT